MSLQQNFYETLLDPDLPPVDVLVSWNGSDVQGRFNVYRNNIISSLIDALADTFPVSQELVGIDFFRAMSLLYVKATLPHSRVLAFYGRSFPEFVAQFPPVASLPYLADVARLEFLRVLAFHSADSEAVLPHHLVQLLSSGADLSELRLHLRPALFLLKSSYAVGSLWLAHHGSITLAEISPETPENMLVIRPQLEVEMLSLDDGDASFIESLIDGETFASAVQKASSVNACFDLSHILGVLLQHQLILSIS